MKLLIKIKEINMNNILSEKEYQKFILEILNKQNGYRIRKNVNYDRLFAMDKEMLFEFLYSTQPETMDALNKIFKDRTEETIVSYINAEITKS
jgi:type I restriction enzyme R subunit